MIIRATHFTVSHSKQDYYSILIQDQCSIRLMQYSVYSIDHCVLFSLQIIFWGSDVTLVIFLMMLAVKLFTDQRAVDLAGIAGIIQCLCTQSKTRSIRRSFSHCVTASPLLATIIVSHTMLCTYAYHQFSYINNTQDWQVNYSGPCLVWFIDHH